MPYFYCRYFIYSSVFAVRKALVSFEISSRVLLEIKDCNFWFEIRKLFGELISINSMFSKISISKDIHDIKINQIKDKLKCMVLSTYFYFIVIIASILSNRKRKTGARKQPTLTYCYIYFIFIYFFSHLFLFSFNCKTICLSYTLFSFTFKWRRIFTFNFSKKINFYFQMKNLQTLFYCD